MGSWYRDQAPVDEEHPVDLEVERRMQGRQDFQDLDARMLSLSGALQ